MDSANAHGPIAQAASTSSAYQVTAIAARQGRVSRKLLLTRPQKYLTWKRGFTHCQTRSHFIRLTGTPGLIPSV